MTDRPFYVYVLKDDAGVPFYVGKGKNHRALTHIFRPHASCSPHLFRRVREIQESGRGLSIEIVGWFAGETEALEREKEFIARLDKGGARSGLLCNIQKPCERAIPTTLYLPRYAVDVVDEEAARQGRSRASMVVEILREAFGC